VDKTFVQVCVTFLTNEHNSGTTNLVNYKKQYFLEVDQNTEPTNSLQYEHMGLKWKCKIQGRCGRFTNAFYTNFCEVNTEHSCSSNLSDIPDISNWSRENGTTEIKIMWSHDGLVENQVRTA
jgi:hypothetical protein